MTAQIRPNRLSVSDRFPMLGFTIRTSEPTPRRVEITLATDPSLFDNRAARRVDNFFSTASQGPLTVEGGEAAYVVPTEVIARFTDAEKLYFALASGPVDGSALTVDIKPGADSPYISIAGLTGRSLRRVRMFPQRGRRTEEGYGDSTGSLTWAGDAAQPGMTGNGAPTRRAGNGKPGNGAATNGASSKNASSKNTPANNSPANRQTTSGTSNRAGTQPAAPADYDDGFGPMPTVPSTDSASEPSHKSEAPEAEAQGYHPWSRAQEAISDNPTTEETERWLNRQNEDRRLAERRRRLATFLPVRGIENVNDDFKLRTFEIAEELGIDVNHLMAVMSFETGGSFSPSQRNAAGSGATGLIQFMPSTARGMDTTTDALAAMTAVEQLEYVRRYFVPFAGRLNNLQDTYMAVLWPDAIGKLASHVLWRQGSKAYEQNSGLDTNQDGTVTAGEAAGRVSAILTQAQTAAQPQAQALSSGEWPAFYQQGKSRDNQSYAAYKAALSSAQIGPASGYGGTELPVYDSELTADDLKEIYPQLAADLQADKVSAAQLNRYADALNQAFALTGLDTVEAQAAYLAHAAVEADQFRRFTETQSWRQNYEDDPTQIRLDANWLNQASQNNTNYRMGGQINPGSDASWQQSFLGRGPLQVTFRYHYAQTLALLERLAERHRAADLTEGANTLMACVEAVKADPRQAASPGYGFLFSAAYMKMAQGDRYVLDAGANPSFNGTGPESAKWMTGGTREEPEKANTKRQAYQRAVAVLSRKLESTQAAAMGARSRAMNAGNPYAVEIKYRMFIPSPVIKGPPGYDDFGGDGRSFRYSGGTSRGEIVATVNLSSGLGIDSINVTKRDWGTSTAYSDDDTFHVSGKPDWWLDKNAGAAVTESEKLAATRDNFDIVPGTSGNRGIRVYAENASAVTIKAEGNNPLLSLAPAIDVDLSVLFRLHNGLIQAKALGNHDGFPAHELYVNGELIHSYDPVAAGNGPSSLFGSGDRDVDTAWVTVARIYTVRAQAANANAMGFNESFTVNWDEVELINQPTNMSCWAAAGAMVIGWRDRVSLSPQTIADIGGRTTATGLDPAEVGKFADELGLVAEPPMSWSQQGFRELLDANGPLWVASAPAGLHAIVVTGLYNEGDQLFVRISDPWDRAVGSPGSPGAYASTHSTGSRYIMKWEDFAAEYERPAHAGLVFLQILHAGDTAGRQPNRGGRTPPGYAQSLNSGEVSAPQVPQAASQPPVSQPSVPQPAPQPIVQPPLQVTLAEQVAPVVPPLTRAADTEGLELDVAWRELSKAFDKTLVNYLAPLPALATSNGWTIGVGRENAGGAVGMGIAISANGGLFHYGPPQGSETPTAQESAPAPLMLTVVEGGIESFTRWSKARAFTASDGVTGALLLSADNIPVGVAMRLTPTGNVTQRIESLVSAIHRAHSAAGAEQGNGGKSAETATTTTAPPTPTPSTTTPAVPPGTSSPAAMAFSGNGNGSAARGTNGTFPPPGVAVFRSNNTVNGVNYRLFLMDGAVLPQMPPAIAADPVPAEQVVIDAWPYIDGPSGRSSGGVAIDWSHAGGTVANVRTSPAAGAALDGWRVTVTTDIAPGPSTPGETRLKVTITTTFERDGATPQTGITDVILTGAGQHEIVYRKEPATASAAA